MWSLPTSLRARVALVTLLGIFMIPLTMSSLRGLTHVLACEAEIDARLTIAAASDEDTAVLLSADEITAEDQAVELCDGLTVDLELGSAAEDEAEIAVTVFNGSDRDWTGTIRLQLGDTPLPIAIGTVAAGATEVDDVTVAVDPTRDIEITGSLLIGP